MTQWHSDELAMPTTDDRVRSAIWFARQGFGIFPVWSCSPVDHDCRCPPFSATRTDADGRCSSPGKHPINRQGFLEATLDEDRIRNMLSVGSEPNYGLVCPDGVLALDVDGDDWQDKMAAVTAKYGPLPDTLTTTTPHGLHVFLRWPDDTPRPLGPVFGWVTRWGTGARAGYVIGPGSVHASGRPYRLQDGPSGPPTLVVASVPTLWVAGALGPSTGRDGTPGPDGPTIKVHNAGYQLPVEGVPAGQRYVEIVRYTAHLYNRGLSEAEMWSLVRSELAPLFTEQLGDAELQARFTRAVHGMADRLGEPRKAATGRSGAVAQGDGVDDDFLLPDESGAFPEPPGEVAFSGLLGELVEALCVDTDAARVAVLGSVLAYAGGLLPRLADWHGAHTSSPFVCLVGQSSVGRKGTAIRRARDGWHRVVPAAVAAVEVTGIQSGEGLIRRLSDRAKLGGTYPVQVMVEDEYARVLQLNKRDGTTLDMILRAAFDGQRLGQHKADSGRDVEPPYWLPALVAITPDELRTRIAADAGLTGSGNRWLYLASERRPVPVRGTPPALPSDVHNDLLAAHNVAGQRTKEPMPIDDDVRDMLSDYAEHLRVTTAGLTARLTARLAVMALRVALVHAAADRAASVGRAHLERAVALTEYGRRSLPWVFGPVLGSPDTRTVYRMLHDPERAATGLYWDVARKRLFHADKVQAAVDELQQLGLARLESTQQPRGPIPGGRPRRVLWPTAVRLAGSLDYQPNRPVGDDGANRQPVSGANGGGDDGGATRAHAGAQAHPGENPPDNTTPQSGAVRPNAAQDSTTVRQADSQPLDGDQASVRQRLGDDDKGAGNWATGPAGTYCWDYRGHQLQHRDVTTDNPWCEVCTPLSGVD